MRLITHDGTFHADEVAAAAVLERVFRKAKIVRTRDEEIIKTASGEDIVFDVGGLYDPAQNRFDHHQQDSPRREDDDATPYSSFGLIWKHFGHNYIDLVLPTSASEEQIGEIWQRMDQGIVLSIDRTDNGIGEITPTDIASIVNAYNRTWDADPDHYDLSFIYIRSLVGGFLRNTVTRIYSEIKARGEVMAAARAGKSDQIVVLDQYMPWEHTVIECGLDDALYVVYPRGDIWYCTAVPDAIGSFGKRKPLPSSWAGKRDEEFASVSGVADGVFCHPALFICGARSREGAIALANKAVASE